MTARHAITLGAVLGALGIAIGAMVRHVVEDRIDPSQLKVLEIGAHYQVYHSLALVLVGTVARANPSRWLSAAAWLFLLGMLLFSGCLYLHVATQSTARPLMLLIPVGGSLLILAWLALAVHGWTRVPAARSE